MRQIVMNATYRCKGEDSEAKPVTHVFPNPKLNNRPIKELGVGRERED